MCADDSIRADSTFESLAKASQRCWVASLLLVRACRGSEPACARLTPSATFLVPNHRLIA